jgi:hypothetical protein
MDTIGRQEFNSRFTEEKYDRLKAYFAEEFNRNVPFRLAETPVFLNSDFKERLIQAGGEILDWILKPEILDYSLKGIPESYFVPGPMGNPNFLALDFGICADEKGMPVPRLIELQGFPSLYGFQAEIGKAYHKVYGISESWDQYFNGFNEKTYLELLKKNIFGNTPREEVILLELDPWNQSTSIDFAVTSQYFDLKVLNIRDIIIENQKLFYIEDGLKKSVQRIYNRVIFDELHRKKDIKLNYHLTEKVEVEWSIHPNWFFRLSKFLLPKIKSNFNPPSYYLKDLDIYPDDLENYVLKPLFSFSGDGVIFNVKKQDLEEIKDKENFILQKKVAYLPIIESPEGGVKAEIRLLYLWDDLLHKPVLVTNLGRLSRGDMIGVKYNKEKTWVGGTVAFFK